MNRTPFKQQSKIDTKNLGDGTGDLVELEHSTKTSINADLPRVRLVGLQSPYAGRLDELIRAEKHLPHNRVKWIVGAVSQAVHDIGLA